MVYPVGLSFAWCWYPTASTRKFRAIVDRLEIPRNETGCNITWSRSKMISLTSIDYNYSKVQPEPSILGFGLLCGTGGKQLTGPRLGKTLI